MARRYKSLHHNLKEGENVVFHREHISPRNRHPVKVQKLEKYERSDRRRWKKWLGEEQYLKEVAKKRRGKKRY